MAERLRPPTAPLIHESFEPTDLCIVCNRKPGAGDTQAIVEKEVMYLSRWRESKRMPALLRPPAHVQAVGFALSAYEPLTAAA